MKFDQHLSRLWFTHSVTLSNSIAYKPIRGLNQLQCLMTTRAST